MSYNKLIELNFKIVERLKFLDSMKTHKEMMRFSHGDQVCFNAPGRDRKFGTLVKFNKKTVSVITESGQRWNVPPHLLSKVKRAKKDENKQGKIVDLHKRAKR